MNVPKAEPCGQQEQQVGEGSPSAVTELVKDSVHGVSQACWVSPSFIPRSTYVDLGPQELGAMKVGVEKKNSIVEAKSPPLPTFCARLRNLGENARLLRDNLGLTLPLF